MKETGTTTPSASIEALKRLKEVETGWDAKIVQTRAEIAARLSLARDASEKVVQAARVEADRKREARLSEVRGTAEVEARKILDDGEREAAAMAGGVAKGVEAAREKLLSAVLGEFRDGSNGGK
jgi:vacuolar-type H+-ATPase subunit H